jgi:hypothetical protein
MQRLRHARFLARLVLAWFALSLGIAIAAPMAGAGSLELVCTGSGELKLQVRGGEGSTPPAGHTLQCPLCASIAAPPPASATGRVVQLPAATPASSGAPARAWVRSAAPPPGRGPPALA